MKLAASARDVYRRTMRAFGFSTRGFDAAQSGRPWRHSSTTPNLAAATLLGPSRIGPRARDAAINQPLAARAADLWASECIGCGMRVVAQTGDDALDALIGEHFEDWSDRADFCGMSSFYGLQAQAALRQFTDGEWIALLTVDDDGELKIRPLDPQQLDNALARELPGGGAIVSGVEIDPNGRPIAYHIFRDFLPGLPLLKGLQTTRIDASDVLHFFEPQTAGQMRGVSKLASVLLRLNEFDQLVGGQLTRLKIGALLTGYITDADGGLMSDPSTHPGEVSLEPGVMQRLRPGESIQFSDPPEIGSESNAFQKAVIREIGAGCGIPSFLLDNDMAEVNFSSARVALVSFRRRVEQWQDHFAYKILRPIYRRWLTIEILSGRINAPLNERTLRHKWIAPKSAYLDPEKDAQAEALAIQNGLMSRKEAVAARGYDIEKIDQEIAADRAREQRFGLSFGAQPQRSVAVPPTDGARAAPSLSQASLQSRQAWKEYRDRLQDMLDDSEVDDLARENVREQIRHADRMLEQIKWLSMDRADGNGEWNDRSSAF